MAFTPINTQEELDAIVVERLNRQKATDEKEIGGRYDEKYKGFISPEDHGKALEELNTQITTLNASRKTDGETIENLKAQVRNYELRSLKIKAAREHELSFDLVDRISGGTEEEINKDAELLSRLVGKQSRKADPPPATTDPAPEDKNDRKTGYKKLLDKMKEE